MGYLIFISILSVLAGIVAGLLLSVRYYPAWEVRKLLRHQQKLGYPHGVWNHFKTLVDHQVRVIVKPNCETLYSTCFVHRNQGPYVLRMPAFNDYFSFAFLNIDTDVEGYITNPDAKNGCVNDFVIAWRQEDMQRAGLKGVTLKSSTAWVIGRFEIRHPDEIGAVNAVQDSIALIPLEDYLHDKRKKD